MLRAVSAKLALVVAMPGRQWGARGLPLPNVILVWPVFDLLEIGGVTATTLLSTVGGRTK